MATAGEPKGGFKQDMVVSIRYRNELPPPPMPPKFLDIDNGGMAQYLTTSFASAMARREEPNIEVDAEGGMPIDMIGIPGYFLGDESAILAPEILPVLDPADHALLLTPDQLRNQDSKTTNVSFLRRTQYMSSQNSRTNDLLLRTNPRTSKSVNSKPAAPVEVLARDDKENIRRHIQKGFDIAYPDSAPHNGPEVRSHPITAAEREAWRNPVHPDNPKLKPSSYYPVLPYFDTATEGSGFASIKFDKPPLPAAGGRRDDRIDVAIMQMRRIEALYAAWYAKKQAYDENPDLYEDPGYQPMDWSLCVPKDLDAVPLFRKALDDADPDKDVSDLYRGSDDGRPQLSFDRVRSYPLSTEQTVKPDRFMAISLYDQEKASKSLRAQGNAAYYYPIFQRTRYRADRGKLGRSQAVNHEDDEANQYDVVSITMREPTAEEALQQANFRGESDPAYAEQFAEIKKAFKAEQERQKALEALENPGGAEDVTMGEEGKTETATNGVNHDRSGHTHDHDADADADAEDDAMADD